MSAQIETRVTVAGREITTGEAARQAAMDLERLGSGVSRTVFSLGDASVLKLAHNEYGKKSNLQERDAWARIAEDGTYIASFAPVQACAEDGSWLVMARVDEVGHSYSPDAALLAAMRAYGIRDMHGANFGYGEAGQAVAVDYAMNDALLDGIMRGDHERGRYSELGDDYGFCEPHCDWCGAHVEDCECCGECEGECQACHGCGNHGANQCECCGVCECEQSGGKLCDDCGMCDDCCECECDSCALPVHECDHRAEYDETRSGMPLDGPHDCGGPERRAEQSRLDRVRALLDRAKMYDAWSGEGLTSPWFVREAGALRADALMIIFPGVFVDRWEAGKAALAAWKLR